MEDICGLPKRSTMERSSVYRRDRRQKYGFGRSYTLKCKIKFRDSKL